MKHGTPLLSVLAMLAQLVSSLGCGSRDASTGSQVVLTGEGATFPAPLYERWTEKYSYYESGVTVEYHATGSGAGIKAIMSGKGDFAGSEAPLTDEQLKEIGEVLHIPTTIAPIAVAYRVGSAPDNLKLTPEVLAAIFLGEIKTWNHQQIAQLNPDSRLPAAPIRVGHRSDGSGTTKVFTEYLSVANRAWKERVGSHTTVKWPVGAGADGNRGLAEFVRRTEGAVGYVSLSFARANKLKVAALWNRAGRFVVPSLDSATAAAAHAAATMPDDLRMSLVDADGDESYPITGFSYILVRRDLADKAKAAALAQFLWWAIHDGQQFAPFLSYATLPPEVVRKAEARLRTVAVAGQPVLEVATP